jgi:hypothetical protein
MEAVVVGRGERGKEGKEGFFFFLRRNGAPRSGRWKLEVLSLLLSLFLSLFPSLHLFQDISPAVGSSAALKLT